MVVLFEIICKVHLRDRRETWVIHILDMRVQMHYIGSPMCWHICFRTLLRMLQLSMGHNGIKKYILYFTFYIPKQGPIHTIINSYASEYVYSSRNCFLDQMTFSRLLFVMLNLFVGPNKMKMNTFTPNWGSKWQDLYFINIYTPVRPLRTYTHGKTVLM